MAVPLVFRVILNLLSVFKNIKKNKEEFIVLFFLLTDFTKPFSDFRMGFVLYFYGFNDGIRISEYSISKSNHKKNQALDEHHSGNSLFSFILSIFLSQVISTGTRCRIGALS